MGGGPSPPWVAMELKTLMFAAKLKVEAPLKPSFCIKTNDYFKRD